MTHAEVRPQADECAPYYQRYITLVPEGDVVETLERQLETTLALLASIPEADASYSYAEGKWTLKESVLHLVDTERVFAYRALRIARGDSTVLSGFDQDAYVPLSNAGARTLADIAEEYGHVRRSTIALVRSLAPEAWERRGTASETPVSLRALAYILAGHDIHHGNVIRERYVAGRAASA